MNNEELKALTDQIREMFPNGHPRFVDKSVEKLILHDRKNGDYAGDDDPLGNFNRVAQIMRLYDLNPDNPADYCLILAMKQIDAIMSLRSRKSPGHVESLKDRAQDVSNYYTIFEILLDEERSDGVHGEALMRHAGG